MNRFNLKNGDMIFFNYLGGENGFVKGRVISIEKEKALVEIGVCGKKANNIFKDTVSVKLDELYPINYDIELEKYVKKNNLKKKQGK